MTEIYQNAWAVITSTHDGVEGMFSNPHFRRTDAIADYCLFWQNAVSDPDSAMDKYSLKDFKNDVDLRRKYWRRLRRAHLVRTESVLITWTKAV